MFIVKIMGIILIIILVRLLLPITNVRTIDVIIIIIITIILRRIIENTIHRWIEDVMIVRIIMEGMN
jgi:hypothetical protein